MRGVDVQHVEQAYRVGGHVRQGVRNRREVSPERGRQVGRRRLSQVRGAPRVSVVEAHDVQPTLDERLQKAERPMHELRGNAHHQQDRRVCRVAPLLVGDVDARRPHAPRDVFVQHGSSCVS